MRFVVVALLLWAAPALPCESSLTGFTVLPVDGSDDVPVNTTPFVVGADLEALLLDANGNPIPSTIQDMIVVGEFGAQQIVRRLVPDAPLPDGSLVRVQSDGSIVSTFTVGATIDGEAPAVEAGLDGTDTECSFARIGVASEDAAFFVGVKNGQPEVGAAVRFDGATSTDQLFIFGEGGAEVNVAGVDLAGNVSAAVPVEVEFPRVSCASGGGALPLMLIALLRRRCRCLDLRPPRANTH